ncbi:MAG: transcription termination factor Rho [SAR202 cluster bacterium]|jgi:transcription termination factor Rho|nr:transcription termination factor Rho [SAR202 cluster bacterium]|tara:strand:- start:131 stop:1411 length:1281 start_codon:yes stop_codon:yes gene_type:complete
MKMKLAELQEKNDEELLGFAVEEGVVEDGATPRRMEILRKMFKAYSEKDETVDADGILSILNEGYGFLRQNSDERGSGDVYVSQSQIRRFSLRPGDYVVGNVRPPKDGERYFGLVKVGQVNETEPDSSKKRVKFEKLTPIFPEELIVMETEPNQLSTRLIDMMSPVGRGQRGLIVSPPKAGKTTLLKELANGITVNAPDIHIMVALIGERPEEVTDMKRSIKGEVYASTFDEPVEDHIRVAELVLERSKRLVESGEDVVILLDSITRLTRAYNLAVPSSGRTLSGGMDPIALYPPKKFFGAARNTEEGGSLTILAACLVDTGSRMDDVVYEEFKGTGNMEVHLDRKMAERRTFPALDIYKSGTRREELLLSEETLKKVWLLRRMITMIESDSNSNNNASGEAMEKVMDRMRKTKNNEEFLTSLGKE